MTAFIRVLFSKMKLLPLVLVSLALLWLTACADSTPAPEPTLPPTPVPTFTPSPVPTPIRTATPVVPLILTPIIGDPGALAGKWQIFKYEFAPIAAMDKKQADTWLRKIAEIKPGAIVFDGKTCNVPLFRLATTNAETYFSTGYKTSAAKLGVTQEKISLIQTGCDGTPYQQVVQLQDKTLIFFWDGVFFFLLPPEMVTDAKRVTFAAGSTSATVSGNLVKNGIDRFVLKAEAGQTLTVKVTSSANVLFSVSGANGDVLKSSGAAGSSWSGTLRATQDYTIALNTPDGNPASYSLQVTIPPPPTSAPQAKRIVFGQGATDATMHGNLAAGQSEHLVLRAQAGQTMNVTLASEPRDSVILIIWGADGNVLISDHATATKWSGKLPKTQDYYIDLRPIAGKAAEYTIFVTVK